MRRIIRRLTSLRPDDDLNREHFSSKAGIIAAAAGSAVGLGNIWRFPYIAGKYGGGAFILVYLLFVIAIGLPIMLSEFSIGRKSRHNVFGAFKRLAPNTYWHIVGIMGICAAFFILAFYGVVGGWSFEYIINSITNNYENLSPEELKQMFISFKNAPIKPIIWQLLFMFLTGYIVISGVKKGIEKFAKILMPLLLVLIIIMAIRSTTLNGAQAGLAFLFEMDFSKLNAEAILHALGQAFFSLSLGMGALITYGSYIDQKDNLSSTAAEVTIADTFVAILAGIVIIPAVFAFGLEPDQGAGLVFITLPNVFQLMPGGYIFSIIFFILLLVAAITSSISVLEVVVAYFVEELNMARKNATIMATALISIFGILCSLSLNEETFPFKIFNLNFFELLEFIAANILLPLGGMLIALFAGWYLGKKRMKKELSNNNLLKVRFIRVYMFIIKFIAPIAILFVFLFGINLIKF